MKWSFAQARRASVQIRAAPLGLDATAALRPHSIYGLVRDRAPLPLLLWVAAQDGLVIEQDNGGFAVMQRPTGDRIRQPGGYRLRLLRWLDRQWSHVVFAAPPVLGMLSAAVTILVRAPALGITLVAASALWLCVFMISMLVVAMYWLSRLGAASAPGRGRTAESLLFSHWSVGLIHQLDPDQIEELMRLLIERLTDILQSDLQASAHDRVRVGASEVTETLVIHTLGITTESAQTAIRESIRAIEAFPKERDVILLASPHGQSGYPEDQSKVAASWCYTPPR